MKTCSTCERRKECVDYKLGVVVGMTSICEFYKEEEMDNNQKYYIVVVNLNNGAVDTYYNIVKVTLGADLEGVKMLVLRTADHDKIVYNWNSVLSFRKSLPGDTMEV